MTVCISAIADRQEAIVSCVDTKITTGVTSYDPTIGRKMCAMRGWTILSAGTTCYSESLVDTFEALLAQSSDNEPLTVKHLLGQALLIELPKYSAARYLTPYGLEMSAFLKSRGTTGFPDELWNELSRAILEYSDGYDVELVVSGWGQSQEHYAGGVSVTKQAAACIFSANRNGVTPHSDDGFYTSGIGSEAAHSILSFFNYEPDLTLAEAVYYVAAAKFMAEKTIGVGRNTVMRIAKRLGEGGWKGYLIQPTEIDEIRKLWEEIGAPRMPDAAEDAIITILTKHQESVRTSVRHLARQMNKYISGDSKSTPSASASSK